MERQCRFYFIRGEGFYRAQQTAKKIKDTNGYVVGFYGPDFNEISQQTTLPYHRRTFRRQTVPLDAPEIVTQ